MRWLPGIDRTWNKDVLERLQTMLPSDDNGQSIYVADSALVTNDNLTLISDKKIPFHFTAAGNIQNIGLTERMGLDRESMEHLGSLVEKKDAAIYQVQSAVRELNGNDYRFIIVNSSSLDKRKEKSIDMIDIKKKELIKDCNALAKREFYCEADANKALELFLAKHDTSLFEINTEIKEERLIKQRVGRPRKDEPISYQIVIEPFLLYPENQFGYR